MKFFLIGTGLIGGSMSKDLRNILDNIQIHGVDKNEIVSDNKQTIIPKYSLEDLEVKLKQAVDEEEYEKAAKIRDKIKDLES